jgi:hypothetical protein
VATALVATSALAQSPHSQPAASGGESLAELWVEPSDLEQRNLLFGAGGAEAVPDPEARYTLLFRDTTGFSRGYDVRDPKGGSGASPVWKL